MADRLSDLIAALETATGPSRELDERIAVEVFGWCLHGSGEFWTSGPVMSDAFELPELTASLDAITGAVRERWPDVKIETTEFGGWYSMAVLALGHVDDGCRGSILHNRGHCMPLALCLAAARLAMAEQGDG